MVLSFSFRTHLLVLLGMQRCPSERVGSVLNPTMGFEGFRILEAAIRKVPSPPANTDQLS